MGEPKTNTAMANQSHAGSGGYQDTTAMEEKAGRHAVEADGDPMVKTAMQEGDASGERKQAAEERQDKDYSPPEEATDTPSSYDGPASRTRATSDAPEDVPELPADV